MAERKQMSNELYTGKTMTSQQQQKLGDFLEAMYGWSLAPHDWTFEQQEKYHILMEALKPDE